MRTLLRKLGLSVAILVGLLVAAELVARWAEPGPMSLLDHSPYVEDARLSYVHRPGFEGRWDSTWYAINSLGWRGPEVQPTFGEDEFRVVALGDSCTFGKGVVEADSWPRQLEALLRAELGPERHPIVFNLGVNGYSLWQYERVLEAAMPRLKPHLVIVGYNVNDYDCVANQADKLVFSAPLRREQPPQQSKPPETRSNTEPPDSVPPAGQQAPPAEQQALPDPRPEPAPPPRPAEHPAGEDQHVQSRPPAEPSPAREQGPTLRARLRALLPRSLRDSLNRSALYRFLRATYYERSRERDYERIAQIVRDLSSQDPGQRDQTLAHEATFLGRLVGTAHAGGADVALFLFPFEAMVVVEDFDREPEDFVRDLADRQGVAFIDVPAAFRERLRQSSGKERLFIRGDRYHPNRDGYSVVAGALLEGLKRLGLLEPRH